MVTSPLSVLTLFSFAVVSQSQAVILKDELRWTFLQPSSTLPQFESLYRPLIVRPRDSDVAVDHMLQVMGYAMIQVNRSICIPSDDGLRVTVSVGGRFRKRSKESGDFSVGVRVGQNFLAYHPGLSGGQIRFGNISQPHADDVYWTLKPGALHQLTILIHYAPTGVVVDVLIHDDLASRTWARRINSADRLFTVAGCIPRRQIALFTSASADLSGDFRRGFFSNFTVTPLSATAIKKEMQAYQIKALSPSDPAPKVPLIPLYGKRLDYLDFDCPRPVHVPQLPVEQHQPAQPQRQLEQPQHQPAQSQHQPAQAQHQPVQQQQQQQQQQLHSQSLGQASQHQAVQHQDHPQEHQQHQQHQQVQPQAQTQPRQLQPQQQQQA